MLFNMPVRSSVHVLIVINFIIVTRVSCPEARCIHVLEYCKSCNCTGAAMHLVALLQMMQGVVGREIIDKYPLEMRRA
jgi:hypothetical protein